jgi:hypothetical protein
MNRNEAINQLNQMFKGQDWFYDTGLDKYGRIVVYANWLNKDIYPLVPTQLEGHQVLLHFAASKTATRDQFVSQPNAPGATLKAYVPDEVVEPDDIDDVVGPEEEEKSLLHLQNELERMEKICGSGTLQHIFYEIQDGKNAVTNMSVRYPNVRSGMEKLYEQYGFDVIYEEIDG